MYVLIFFGIVFAAFSLLLFFAPNVIRKLDEWGRKELFSDKKAHAHRITLGIFLLAAAWSMFYFALVKRITP